MKFRKVTIICVLIICFAFSFEGLGYSFPDTAYKTSLRKPMAFQKGSPDASRIESGLPGQNRTYTDPLSNSTFKLQVTGNTYWIRDKSTRRRIVRLVRTIGQSIQNRYRVLEMGVGSGLLTKILVEDVMHRGRTGVKFFGTDIEPSSVTDAKCNLDGIEGVEILGPGDLFSTLKDDLKFNVIFWNPPWYKHGVLDSNHAMVDPDNHTLRRFMESAPLYLTKNGKIYIIFPCRLDETLRELAQDTSLTFRKISGEHDIGLYEFHPVDKTAYFYHSIGIAQSL